MDVQGVAADDSSPKIFLQVGDTSSHPNQLTLLLYTVFLPLEPQGALLKDKGAQGGSNRRGDFNGALGL